MVLRGPRTGIRLLVLGAALLLVLGAGASFGYRALRDSNLFAVQHIVVTGANAALSAQVQAAVRESAGGRGLLALSPGKLARAIEGVPGVHVARVDRDFPSTLRVRVWPEHAIAIAKSGHDRVVVSSTGRVLARIDNRAKPPNLPRIPLPGHGVPRVGTRIQNPKVLSQLSAIDAIPWASARAWGGPGSIPTTASSCSCTGPSSGSGSARRSTSSRSCEPRRSCCARTPRAARART